MKRLETWRLEEEFWKVGHVTSAWRLKEAALEALQVGYRPVPAGWAFPPTGSGKNPGIRNPKMAERFRLRDLFHKWGPDLSIDHRCQMQSKIMPWRFKAHPKPNGRLGMVPF